MLLKKIFSLSDLSPFSLRSSLSLLTLFVKFEVELLELINSLIYSRSSPSSSLLWPAPLPAPTLPIPLPAPPLLPLPPFENKR